MRTIEAFKKFILRGNLADMAIGFTVGAAFTTVAKSLVNDVIMPVVGLMTGKADFSDLYWLLREGPEEPAPYLTLADAQAAGAVTLNYGQFVNSVVALFLVAGVMFILIRMVNRLDAELDEPFVEKKESGEPENKKCPDCRTSIPYRAVRCPNCTSHLDPVVNIETA